MQLILASNSPRRRELLALEKIPFTVVPSQYEEIDGGLSAQETVMRFAEGKAEEVFSRYPGAVVIGADTVVSLDGEILGKPKSPENAVNMLKRLSGRTHSVFSGVCLLKEGLRLKGISETKVTFNELSDGFIERYVASALPLDKAGAYGIQDAQDGYPIVKSYDGSYTNVVGFPMELVREFIRKAEIC